MPDAELSIGQRCFANPSGPGAPSGWVTVERRLVDGTYAVMPVGATNPMDRWEGVTGPELSIDDAAQWPAAFARLRGDLPGVDQAQAAAALTALGYDVPRDQLAELWPAGASFLDEGATQSWFSGLGYGAALFIEPAPPPHERLFQFYWNSLRMGGRAPADIGRAITLVDTFAALDLDATRSPEPAEADAIAALEHDRGLRVPPVLRALWTAPGASTMILEHHPNNPQPRAVADWTARAAPTVTCKAHAVEIMDPHQGPHRWLAVFDDTDDDAEIWIELRPTLPPWRCAPSAALFFWDLAQTHRAWAALRAEERAGRSDGFTGAG